MRRILISLDGSLTSELILGPAVALAGLTGASCTLLHVVESPAAGAAQHPDPPTERAQAYLEALAGRLRGQAPAVRARVVVARHVAASILDGAHGYDLIALATHGRGGLKRLLLGSVADKVLRGADAPVLLARQGDQAKAGQD